MTRPARPNWSSPLSRSAFWSLRATSLAVDDTAARRPSRPRRRRYGATRRAPAASGMREGDAHARQVGVGDEGVEAVAVPVDPQERHVPAANDRRSRRGRCTNGASPTGVRDAPEEGERAALRTDVARRVPRDIAVVVPLDRAADRAVGHDPDLVLEIGHRIAAALVGDQALVGGNAEEEVWRSAAAWRAGARAQRQRPFANAAASITCHFARYASRPSQLASTRRRRPRPPSAAMLHRNLLTPVSMDYRRPKLLLGDLQTEPAGAPPDDAAAPYSISR